MAIRMNTGSRLPAGGRITGRDGAEYQIMAPGEQNDIRIFRPMTQRQQDDIRLLNELFLSCARDEARDDPDTAALRLGLDRDTVRLLSRIPQSALRRMALPDTLMFAPRSAGAFSELLRTNSVADRLAFEIRCLEE